MPFTPTLATDGVYRSYNHHTSVSLSLTIGAAPAMPWHSRGWLVCRRPFRRTFVAPEMLVSWPLVPVMPGVPGLNGWQASGSMVVKGTPASSCIGNRCWAHGTAARISALLFAQACQHVESEHQTMHGPMNISACTAFAHEAPISVPALLCIAPQDLGHLPTDSASPTESMLALSLRQA